MKKLLLLPVLLLLACLSGKAAPGDTTVVQSHTLTQLANYGDYDSPVNFTDTTTTYRQITMTFTLGKYQCPGNPQYCGDWDYTVQVFLVTPDETFELGRFMTPYANVSRFPMTWKHRYNFDVTDYAQYLKGNNTLRIHYSGYSGGFTANVKFTCIEGTPPRNVVRIDRLWAGAFDYGKPVSIENQVYAKSLQMPATATDAVLKFNVTGHGANAGDVCSEFCSKYYQVKVNNALINQTNIWRNNCGLNNLYPQTGTWVYDRANWCPGDVVASHYHPLNVASGSNYLVDVDFQPYTYPNSQASYIVEGQVIYYGPYNYATDAAVESIISPNNYEGYFRSNPVCQEAEIMVRNTGSTPITSLDLAYGIEGSTLQTITKNVQIQPGASSQVLLPALPEYMTVSNALQTFVVNITGVNGAADNSAINNGMKSQFAPMPVWPNRVSVRLTTNLGSVNGFNETSWKLLDAAGNTVYARAQNTNQTVYNDTLQLQAGCYRLVVEDAGCDGLQWWANPNQGSGNLMVRNLASNALITMPGYFAGDFGCGFTQAFRVTTVLGTEEVQAANLFSVYPNPSSDHVKVSIRNTNGTNAHTLELFDALGKKVYAVETKLQDNLIPVHDLPSGVYLLRYKNGAQAAQQKIVVSH